MATQTNPFLDFGQQPVGTPGATTGQVAQGTAGGIKGLIGNIAGPIGGNQSTVPFAGGGNVSPNNLQGGMTLNGVTTLGIQAKSPTQNIATQPNTLPSGFASTSGINGAGKTATSAIPAGYSYDAQGRLTNNAGQVYSPNQNAISPSFAQSMTPTTGSTAQSGAAPQVAQPANAPTYTPSNPVTLPQLLNQTANNASQPSAAYQQAIENYNKAAEDLKQSQMNQAAAMASNSSNPIPLEFQQGRGQVLQTQYGQQQQALGSRLSAASTALGAANTQGQIQQQGLLGAAALTVPQLGQYGQTYYNPLTQSSANSSGNFGTGPAAAANVQSVQEQTKQVNDWNAARQSAGNLENQLTSFVNQNGINPSDFNAVNKFLQSIGAQTSSPQYQTFKNIINDLASVYAQILTPSGGSQTDMVRSIAQSLVDATASGKSISSVLQGLSQQAQNKISGVQTNIQNLQGGGQSQSSSGGMFGGFFQ